ncbi:sulfate adenylyltransferase (ADP) / ATP adenylyltransferase [Alternaria panax]|uniref:Sulfate adenylyltransferase (ADP) / ATP adenylyltransferase n=1 Tax=Alternaria panax TaxID=48097 RepID=A0AAD4FBC8_9PLEO|nr:sulfate adenylyltransferase (ADP) / ATP adenylyltransferase [Alternaria panax]
MTSSYPAQSATMEDPGQGWKPNNRPQSTVARNFMSELDSLFNLDGGLEVLDKTVLEKKQAVTTQTKELEALEARLKAAEERLNQAKSNSPPAKKDTQREQDAARLHGAASPLAQKTQNMPGALPDTPTPSSTTSADYVLVERPLSAKPETAYSSTGLLSMADSPTATPPSFAPQSLRTCNMDDVTEAALTETFDKLVTEGVIVHGPHKSITVEDEGYPIEFRICPALATKPHTVGATNHAFDQTRKLGPGSDMFCPDERLMITQVNGTHDLALNLFCVDRPQLLMTTLDSYKRQHEALDVNDFTVMLEVLRKFPNIYVIFNCGERGGCSRIHKHLQGLKGPPHAFNYIMSSLSEASKKVPYQFFVYEFSRGFKNTSASTVLDAYNMLLAQCRSLVGTDGEDTPPHNVVMWAERLVVIPRRTGTTEGASANAGGMLGSVWVSGQEHVDKWSKVGYANVLRELGVPRS